MISIENKMDCCGCSACAQICPKHCIDMRQDEEGFYYPHVDPVNCIGCDLCERVCPLIQKKPEVKDRQPLVYAAYNKDLQIRLESSSGGIFSALAKAVLAEQGAVFGAALSDDCRTVSHICVEDQNMLPILYGSKYVQSKIGSSYSQTEKFLTSGKKVLFCGTPCQVEGLRSYLRRDYENLICVDFICHGVPSPELWSKYTRWNELQSGSPVADAKFRSKERGWRQFSMRITFEDGKQKSRTLSADPYLRMFLQNLCLRPSCYHCVFKKLNRESDITLADFWGGDLVVPDMDDDKGLSMVLLHSDKGRGLFEKIAGQLVYQKVDAGCVKQYNPAAVESCNRPQARAEFMQSMASMDIPQLAEKFLPKPSMQSRIKWMLKKILTPEYQKKLKRFLHGVRS